MCDHYDKYFPEERTEINIFKRESPTSKEIYDALKQQGSWDEHETQLMIDSTNKIDFDFSKELKKQKERIEAPVKSPVFGEWQLCPKCQGSGFLQAFGTVAFINCDVCKGAKILAKPVINV